MKLYHGSNMEIFDVDLKKCMPYKDFGKGFYTTADTIGLLVRQFQRGLINEKYLTEEFSFGKVTNQYTFHTEKALKYLKKAGVKYDK